MSGLIYGHIRGRGDQVILDESRLFPRMRLRLKLEADGRLERPSTVFSASDWDLGQHVDGRDKSRRR